MITWGRRPARRMESGRSTRKGADGGSAEPTAGRERPGRGRQPARRLLWMLLAGLLPVATAGGVAGCARGGTARPARQTKELFQSVCTISLYDHIADSVFDAVWARLAEIDGRMSMWKGDSELSRLNAAAGKGPVPASEDLLETVRRGLELARLSGGRYDPTVGPLVKLWAIGTPEERVPERDEIATALGLLDWRGVVVDLAAGTVALPRSGMALDFGSQAKGYGAKAAGEVLEAAGVESALVDVGGCILAYGANPSGTPWRIGVQDPSGTRGSATVGYLLARDRIASTSGIYERRFVSGGHSYHHIMDTSTGFPVENGVVSVTVLSDRHENADGPTLAFLALGAEEGIATAERMGLPAVFILEGKRIRLSSEAKGLFALTDPDYTLES